MNDDGCDDGECRSGEGLVATSAAHGIASRSGGSMSRVASRCIAMSRVVSQYLTGYIGRRFGDY